jgi:hypothetical protein
MGFKKTFFLEILHNQEKYELRTLIFINQLVEKIAYVEIVCFKAFYLSCSLHFFITALYGTILYFSAVRYHTVR